MTDERYIKMRQRQRKQQLIRRKRRARVIAAAFIVSAFIVILVTCIMAANSDKGGSTTRAETPTGAATDEPYQTHAQTEIAATEPTSTPTQSVWEPDEADVEIIAKTLYGECRGVRTRAEQAAVVWCILNRVDSEFRYFPDTIEEVITKKNQFVGYDPAHPVIGSLEEIARDVLIRWHNEKCGEENVGRVLPKEYVYFTGDGFTNTFTVEWKGTDYWDWSLTDPYTE